MTEHRTVKIKKVTEGELVCNLILSSSVKSDINHRAKLHIVGFTDKEAQDVHKKLGIFLKTRGAKK